MAELDVVEHLFTWKVFVEGFEGVSQVTGCSLKCSPNNVLVILKANGAEGPVVAFVGGSGIKDVFQKVSSAQRNGGLRWRQDQFTLDKITKSE